MNQIFSLIKKFRQDRFFVSSGIIFIGSVLVGASNYVYQLLMVRRLTVSEYGEFQSLLALYSVVIVFGSAISLIAIKYTAEFWAQKQLGKIHSLLLLISKKVFWLSFFSYILFLFFSDAIATFLNLTSTFSVALVGIACILGFLNAVVFGVLRGMQKFQEFSYLSLLQSLLKIIFSLVFIYLGFSLQGAIGGLVLSSLIGYWISFYPLKFLFQEKKELIHNSHIIQYSFPVLCTLFASMLLSNIDVILVKHFFPSELAGQYSVLAMIGRILFFITAPIATVMFPMAADAHAASLYPAKVFKKALLFTGTIGLSMIFFYFLFPEFIIHILVGDKFLPISGYLGVFSCAVFLYTIVYLFANYFLSLGHGKSGMIAVLGALLQVFAIYAFHDTLWHIIFGMIAVLLLLIFIYSGYFIKLYYLCPKK